MPNGIKAVFAAIPPAGIVFAYLGFEQADQLAGEVKDPQRNLPRAIIIACLLGTAIYILLQMVFIGAMPPDLLTQGFGGDPRHGIHASGPFAAVAALGGLGFWATILRIDAFVSPFGTGLIYQTSTSRVGYGLARNRYFPQIFQAVNSSGVPWFSLIMAFVFGLFFLLPFPSWQSLVGLVTSASVLMYAGAPLSLGAFRRKLPDAVRPYRLPAAAFLSPLGFIICSMLIYWSGFVVVWKLGVVPGDRLHPDRHLHGVRPAAAAAAVEVRAVAAGLPDRHGHHLLAGSVPAQGRRRGAADQHLPHPVLVGHPDRGGLQPGHLLLGDVHRPDARGDAATRSCSCTSCSACTGGGHGSS